MQKIIAYIFGLILLTSSTAFAAGPVYVELTAQPGETVHGQLTLFNNSDVSQEIVISKADLENLPGLQEWLILVDNSVRLEPKATHVMPYEINIPEDAASQGYYGSLSIDEETAQIVLLAVEGDLHEEVVLKDFNLKSDTAEFEVTISNKGNVHSSPVGTIEVIDRNGDVVQSREINKEKHGVFPGINKIYTAEYNPVAGEHYAILKGEAPLQAQLTLEKNPDGELNILDKKLGKEDSEELKNTLARAHIARDVLIVIVEIFLLTVCVVALVRYCFKCTICAHKNPRKSKKRVVKGKKK